MDCVDYSHTLTSSLFIGSFAILLLLIYLLSGLTQSLFLKRSLYFVIYTLIVLYAGLLTNKGNLVLNSMIKSIDSLNQDKRLYSTKILDLDTPYAFIYFGYTFCPDVCPTTLGLLAGLYKKKTSELKDIPTYLITLDPNRDSDERLKNYTSFFFKELRYKRYNSNDLKQLTTEFDVRYKVNTEKANYYTVDHSAFVYLVSKNGEIIKRFSHPINTDEVILTINTMQKESQK